MLEKERIFLTFEETLVALQLAFTHYPFQLNLLTSLFSLVFDDSAYLLQDVRSQSVWIKIPGKNKLIPSSEEELKDRIMIQLQQSVPAPEKMARICTLVFGARVLTESDTKNIPSPGFWIETDMAGFVCTRCGHCCRTLNYKDGCTVRDYQTWKEKGRTDILDWVGVVCEKGKEVVYRIWMIPGTNEFAQTCPWLKKAHDQNQYRCVIHGVRPTICRQYPGSRKHARLTGCKGI